MFFLIIASHHRMRFVRPKVLNLISKVVLVPGPHLLEKLTLVFNVLFIASWRCTSLFFKELLVISKRLRVLFLDCLLFIFLRYSRENWNNLSAFSTLVQYLSQVQHGASPLTLLQCKCLLLLLIKLLIQLSSLFSDCRRLELFQIIPDGISNFVKHFLFSPFLSLVLYQNLLSGH